MIEERLSYQTLDGFTIVGLRGSPARRRGWVVLMHGITESKDEYGGFYVDLANELRREGFGTLRFDFRGHGESSGSSKDISVIGDVLDIESTLQQIPLNPNEELAFIGTSFGAGPAIMSGSTWHRGVNCLVLIAPVLDYRRTFLEPETDWGKTWFSQKAFRELWRSGQLTLENFSLSPRLFEEFRFLRPMDVLAESRIPTLIIHGDKDSVVPYQTSLAAANSIPSVRLHTLAGADHGFPHFEDETGTGPESQRLKAELIREAVRFVAGHS